MQPRISADRAFDKDPLHMFTSETPVASPKAWEPRSLPPSTFAPVRESNRPIDKRRHSNSVRLFLAVAASLATGILIGFAGGYTSAQRIGTPLAAMIPASWIATAEDSTRSPAAAASRETPASKRASDPSAAPSQPPDGAPTWRAEAESGRGLAERANLPQVPEVSPPAARRASIEVLSLPAGATVALDGRVVGRTPLSIPNVPEGTHVIGMELPGFDRWATSVHVNAGERTRVAGSLSP